MSLSVLVSWASSVSIQLVLFFLLLSEKKFKRLPYFFLYVALNLCQAGFLVVVYSAYGFDSHRAASLAWDSECVAFLAQALATVEILRLTLKPYKGIWGLAWRALAIVSAVVVVLVALTTWGSWTYSGWFQLNRGYHITFASALVACLLVVRYYSIPVPRAYKMIMAGFCLYSSMDVLVNTILQSIFYRTYIAFQPICEFLTLLSFLLALGLWIAAMWKSLPPQPPDASAAPPNSMYQQLSPEINEQLRKLNDKLEDFWKMEARPN